MNTDEQSTIAAGTFSFTPVTWPMNIFFHGLGELVPTDDITPKEAVHLTMMLACAMVPGNNSDYVGFAKSHGLERHFKAQRS